MRNTLTAIFLLVIGIGAIAQNDPGTKVELRESPFFDGEVTFSTPGGERTLKVALKQLQMHGGARVELPLPEKGMLLLQHRAGDVKLSAGRTEFKPIEGEWMTIDLPEGVTLSTEDDSALVDAIVVSE